MKDANEKRQDGMNEARVSEEVAASLLAQIIDRKYAESHAVSNHVLDDCILHEVAKKAWEEELVGKFQRRYMVNWSEEYGSQMYYIKPDDKIDDS